MRSLPRSVAMFASCAALIAAGGCGSAIQAMPGAAQRTGAQAAVQVRQRPQVYVAQANGGGTGVAFSYRADNRKNALPRCSLTGQSFVISGIAADARGNLYLPNVSASSVDVYRPSCGKLLAHIADSFGAPIGVAVRGNTVYAANTGNVAVCNLKGCSSTLTDPNVRQITSVAVDGQGNVWAALYDQPGAVSLMVWPGGVMPGHLLSGYATGFDPGAIAFDKSGTLITVVSGAGKALVFTCSVTTLSCTTTATIALQGRSEFGALNSANTEIQITDITNTSVDVYAYPSFVFEFSYNSGLFSGYAPIGIAQVP